MTYTTKLNEIIDEMRWAAKNAGSGLILTYLEEWADRLAALKAAQPAADCQHCGGLGDVSGEYPGVACPVCNGSGKAAQPAAPSCDMAELCIGCEPRNVDGSCPDAQPAQQAPEGWRLVPVEPTAPIIYAGVSAYEDETGGNRLPDADGHDHDIARAMYRAMLAASPLGETNRG